MQRLALKLGACLAAFVWAFVSIEYRWGVLMTFVFAVLALSFGASAALDLGRLGQETSDSESRAVVSGEGER